MREHCFVHRRCAGSWSATTTGILCAMLVALAGCHNQGHREAYHAKMASEIRVLEDQLYDADYQNRVLREKLHRTRSELTHQVAPVVQSPSAPTSAGQTPTAPERTRSNARTDDTNKDMFDFGDSTPDNDAFDAAETVPPPDPEPSPRSKPDEPTKIEIEPAPGLPEPPGPSDIDVPPIDPGEILPPPAPGEADIPPGKIEVPDFGTLPEPAPIPESLQLHSGLSGGYRFDGGQREGLYLVVNVIDDRGRVMDLDQLDIDATMTIVALDPTRDASEARIARWEYEASEIRRYIRSQPVAGLHVPVKWQDSRPDGDEVIVHVRLQTEDEEMRCQGRLSVSEPAAIADWTPRGGKQKR